MSCPLLSSSSHCVVSTLKKRGTKTRKKVFHNSPRISPSFLRLSSLLLHALVHSSHLSSCRTPSSLQVLGRVGPVWSSSHRTSQIILSWLLPSRSHEDCVQATPRVSRWLSLWETPGSSSSPVALWMCFGFVCVNPLLTSWDSVKKNISTVDQFNMRHVFPMPACLHTN